MDNQEIIEKIYLLQLHLRKNNPALAGALERSTIPLLEYEGSLADASSRNLLGIKGVGKAGAALVARIIAGEHPYEISLSIPPQKKMKAHGAE